MKPIDTLQAAVLFASLALAGCQSHPASFAAARVETQTQVEGPLASNTSSTFAGGPAVKQVNYIGFDRNEYPGDPALAGLHQRFSFAGFWLNNPPGARRNTWAGHRPQMLAAGFGFLVLWNGRLDAEIKHANVQPEALGRQDAESAVAAARHEGFPDRTIIFLDQEEGGRLLPEQSAYFFGFTETIAASPYRAGAYLSGQPADDGPGSNGRRTTITTAEDVHETISAKQLHHVALWVSQDACPPAPGCTVDPAGVGRLAPRDSGTLDAEVWQYAQSPQRPELTRACAKTYGTDGNCYAGLAEGGATPLFVDLNLASSADPSHGR